MVRFRRKKETRKIKWFPRSVIENFEIPFMTNFKQNVYLMFYWNKICVCNRLVPDMTLTLKKASLTLKIGGSVHLTQCGHVLLWLCYWVGSSYLGSYRELSWYLQNPEIFSDFSALIFCIWFAIFPLHISTYNIFIDFRLFKRKILINMVNPVER